MATLWTNFISGTLSSDISNSDTTISSSEFANLPVVSGSDIIWLVLDPAESAGAAEIVKVTAHTSASTSVTVVRGQQGSTARSHLTGVTAQNTVTKSDLESFLTSVATDDIADGAVIGAKVADDAIDSNHYVDGSIDTDHLADGVVTNAKMADDAVDSAEIADGAIDYVHLSATLVELLVPAGTLRATINATQEPGWLNHDQSIPNADTYYPTLWGKAPASWKSGSTLTIPDLSDVALIGAGTVATLGATGGSNTATLSADNLPAHDHPINHGHADTLSVASNGSHTHSVAGTAASAGSHTHGSASGLSLLGGTFGGGTFNVGAGSNVVTDTFTAAAGSHTHSVSGTAASAGSHTHTLSGSVTDHTGTSGSTGSGDAFSIVASSLGVNIQIKAH